MTAVGRKVSLEQAECGALGTLCEESNARPAYTGTGV
jgi:hypothetical protein